MSDSQDQSYYEIALTNRQVLTIFVVLLACVMAAFLGGVWLAKDDSAVVASTSAQVIAGDGVNEGDIAELEFFNRTSAGAETGASSLVDDGTKPAQGSAEAAVEETPRIIESSVSGGSGGSGASGKSVGSSEPGERRPRKRKRAEPSTFMENLTPERVADRVIEATETPKAAKGKAAPLDPAEDALVVQVFSSPDGAQAARLVGRLRDGGYPAIVSPVDVDGQTLHRVRIGPYSDRDEAQTVADRVRRAFKLDTWITN